MKYFISNCDAKGCDIGGLTTCKVIIENDDELAGVGAEVAKLLKMNLDQYKLGGKSWEAQFQDALEGPPDGSGIMALIANRLVMPFKLLAALIPPTTFAGGWLCFFVSLAFIGIITALIGDIANMFGCSVGLKASVTAITVVALGTSLPDTFASMAAAVGDATADNSIGNVTGSSSVNVFLGLGLPWTMAAIVHTVRGDDFRVEAGGLSFSVAVFSICAVITLGLIYVRGHLFKAELGGPYQTPTSVLLVCLWLLYIILSILKDYGYI